MADRWDELDPHGPPELVFVRPPALPSASTALLLGAFDPPTSAHLALAVAAAERCGSAAFCLTKVLLDRDAPALLPPRERLELLDAVADGSGLGVAIANRGRYVDVDDAARRVGVDPVFAVGSDKLAQIADARFYADGQAGARDTLSRVAFLVVERVGPHGAVEHAIALGSRSVRVAPGDVFADPAEASISATEVRDRLKAGEPIDGLVPPIVAEHLRRYTGGTNAR